MCIRDSIRLGDSLGFLDWPVAPRVPRFPGLNGLGLDCLSLVSGCGSSGDFGLSDMSTVLL